MRKILSFLLLLVPTVVCAQTTVNLSVTDTPDTQTWNNGTWKVNVQFPPGSNQTGPFFVISGGGSIATQSGSLSATGTASFALPANINVAPGGTQWLFTVCPQASAPCFTQFVTIITSSPQTVALTPPSIRINLQNTAPPVSAYSTTEIVGAVIGSHFYLLGTGGQDCSVVSGNNCTTWTSSGGVGSPVPGVFNSNFDPPLFQNYTLTTTGPQAGINLSGNSIDTQQISWRPVGFTTLITDTFIYNTQGFGTDLHTNNVNWVYQSGTFSVSLNANAPSLQQGAYGSSTNGMAYRSDGPSTASEWAQETVAETGVAQNHGPCVRASTVAFTAYCVQATTGVLRLVFVNAGTFNVLKNDDGQSPVTGDIIGIQASGTTISMFKNGVLIDSAVDANLASGSVGMFSAQGAGNTISGALNFQAGTGPFPQCIIALDSSPDNVSWTAGGAIPATSCVTPGSQQIYTSANYVRVNLLQWNPAATNVAVVYSGRLAPASANSGSASVSNGQWVTKGEVVWFQITSQGVGNVNVQSWVRLLQPNGVPLNSGPLTVAICGTNNAIAPGNNNTPSGVGYGYVIPVNGWLQSAVTQINTPGFPQGTFYMNIYLMYQMPTSGTTNSCTSALQTNNPNGMLLSSAPVGSSYPSGFTGTTLNYASPWSIPGYQSAIPVANPAAGTDFTLTTNTTNNENPRICIVGASYTITASASAGNRFTSLQILSSGGPILYYISNIAQTVSQVVNYSFSPGAAEVSQVLSGTTVFHSVPFNNGQPVCSDGATSLTIKSLTGGILAGDQISNIKIWTTVQQDNN